MLPRRRSARMLLATFLAVGLIRIVAIPLDPMLALVCAWFTVPLLVETLWVTTDSPRSHLTRWWLTSLVLLLAVDTSATALDGETRLIAVSVSLVLATSAQVVALGDRWRSSALVEERGWLWIFGIGLALVAFAVTYSGAAHEHTTTGVLAMLAATASAAAAVFATALGPRGIGGGILGFLAVLVILISTVLGNEGPAATVGTVVLGLAGQALLLLTIVDLEEVAAEERRILLAPRDQWDVLSPTGQVH